MLSNDKLHYFIRYRCDVTINPSGVYIDNAMVTVADVVADNGYVIDAVLLPNPGYADPTAQILILQQL